MAWGNSIIREIADRRCIIFLGAGASAGCTGAMNATPPNWTNLLHQAMDHLNSDAATRSAAEDQMAKGNYLNSAEIIFARINMPDMKDFFKSKFLTPRYTPSEVHKIIHDLDAKIVIQTNYDVIYEKECGPIDGENGYSVKKYYDDNILDEIKSPSRLIVKAHGCVREAEKIILTRSQYFKIKSQHQDFYKLLDSLFLTHTILFIGCSLTDPDIQLVLENTNIAVNCNHPHYALMPAGEHAKIIDATRLAFNIQYVEYPNEDGTHANMITMLQDLKEQVISMRAIAPN